MAPEMDVTFLSSKLNHIKHNTDNCSFLIEIPPKFEVIQTRLGIGHTQISHSYLLAKEQPPICSSVVSMSPSIMYSLNAEYIKISKQ